MSHIIHFPNRFKSQKLIGSIYYLKCSNNEVANIDLTSQRVCVCVCVQNVMFDVCNVYTYMYVIVIMYVCGHVFVNTFLYIYIIYIYMHVLYVCMYVLYVCMYVHAYIYMHVLYVCMYACTVCVYVCTCTVYMDVLYVWTYGCASVGIHVCMYCMCICKCIGVYVHVGICVCVGYVLIHLNLYTYTLIHRQTGWPNE